MQEQTDREYRICRQIDPDELDEIVFVQELGVLQGAAVSRQSFRKDLQSGKTGHGTFSTVSLTSADSPGRICAGASMLTCGPASGLKK